DAKNSPKVVMVNRSFARQYLSDSAIGDKISNFATGDGTEWEVIGIINDVLERGLTEPVQPEIYSLNRQMSPSLLKTSAPFLVLHTNRDPRELVAPVKTMVREYDSSLAIESVMTMDDR